jgi:hypothetical protein
MTSKIYDWSKEFLGLELGDKRLYNRLETIMSSISAAPDQSIFLASGSRDSAKAAYRFLANDKVNGDLLLDSVAFATKEKIRQMPNSTILCIQDTTSISYGKRQHIDGMGYYSGTPLKGMNVHSCIAVTQEGLPLGILHQQSITREKRKDDSKTKDQKRYHPIEEKESYRWLTTMEKVSEYLPIGIRHLHICDREGDIYELFDLAAKQKELFLVRVTQNRMTTDGKLMLSELKAQAVKGQLVVRIGRNPLEHTPTRNVLMNYTYGLYQIQKPAKRKEKNINETLIVSGIYVYESGVADGIHWLLLTNESIMTDKGAVAAIENYAQRWKIERFHYILKSGCRIEEKQVRSYEKLQLLTLLYSVIAMRLLNMTYIGRLFPDIPCSLLLEKEEWEVLYCITKKDKTVPDKAYSLKESILYLGQLGGFKGAPSDGMPGAKVLWTGLEKLLFIMANREFIV